MWNCQNAFASFFSGLLLIGSIFWVSAFASAQSGDFPEPGTTPLRLLITADPQFGNGDNLEAENARSRATLNKLGNIVLNSSDEEVIIIIAGDLTQNTRRDEFDDFKEVIEPFADHVYESIGNHDEMPTSFWNGLLCPFFGSCIAKGNVLDYVDRPRALPILFSQKCGALYVFKARGIYFVQLGVGVTREGYVPQTVHYNYESLRFLEHVLENVVTPDDAPVIIIMHVPAPVRGEVGTRLEAALKKSNVIALFFGHTHSHWLIDKTFPYVFSAGSARNGSYFDLTVLGNYFRVRWPDGRNQLLPFSLEPQSEPLNMTTVAVANYSDYPGNSPSFTITDFGAGPQIMLVEESDNESSSKHFLGTSHCFIPLYKDSRKTLFPVLDDGVRRCLVAEGVCPVSYEDLFFQGGTGSEAEPLSGSPEEGAFFLGAGVMWIPGVVVPVVSYLIYRHCRGRCHVRR